MFTFHIIDEEKEILGEHGYTCYTEPTNRVAIFALLHGLSLH